MNDPLLIYLHGFNSSPQSWKAQQLLDYLTQRDLAHHYAVPALNYRPDDAIRQLEQQLDTLLPERQVTLIGSSLGGYYASYLVERYAVNAVLINPAVTPYRLLDDVVGRNTNLYSGEEYDLTPELVNSLRAYEVDTLRDPSRYRVYLQTADETLDYREAEAKYRACPLFIEQGGSHGYEGFERIIPEILAFAGFDAS